MPMRLVLAGLGFAALCVLPFRGEAQPAAPGVTDAEIKIGMNLPLSGPASFVGQGARVGTALAVSEINSHGGINGRKLSVVHVDDEGSPDGGNLAVRRLVDEDQVFFVLGAGTSTSTVPVLPYFERNGVPCFVSLASDPAVVKTFRKNIYSGATASQATMAQGMADLVMVRYRC